MPSGTSDYMSICGFIFTKRDQVSVSGSGISITGVQVYAGQTNAFFTAWQSLAASQAVAVTDGETGSYSNASPVSVVPLVMELGVLGITVSSDGRYAEN